METRENLLEERVSSIFLRYLIPSIAGMLGTAVYFLGDTIIIGKALGSGGLAALNIVLPIFRLINALALVYGVGGATCFAISRGQDDLKVGNNIFNISLLLSLITGIGFIIIRIFFLDWLIGILGATEGSYLEVRSYLSIYLYFATFTILNSVLGVFVRNDGSPNLVMVAMIVSSLSNIVIDYILVFPMELGIWGAALATGISPIIGILILSTHFLGSRRTLKITRPNLKKSFILWIGKNGFTSFILEFSVGIVIYLFNMELIKIEGDLGLSAYGIIANISLVVAGIFNGVGQSIQPIVSTNYGAKKLDRAKEAGRLGIKTSTFLGFIFLALGYIFPYQLTGFFLNEGGRVVDLVVRGIRIYFLGFIFMGINMAIISYIQSREEVLPSVVLSLLRGSILIILLLRPLAGGMGIDGVWLTTPLAEVITSILAIYILKYKINKKI